ncbi:MAG: hypothetical protein PHV13_04845 [Candidatus ainarchaeum sp.]|nr:hypothetical protein [Candidatus ainarchaeum sp.]
MKEASVLLLCAIVLCGCTENLNQDAFAKCLGQKGVKMYGAEWCGHCESQKDAFGASWQYVNYVECADPTGTQAPACRDAGITGYPTWEFANGSRSEGQLSLDELGAITGCEMNHS